MAAHHELFNFVNKFLYLWKSGFEANLHVEAQNGQAFVNLQAGLGSFYQVPQKHLNRRKPGPSRLRRRQRRAAARQAAEEVPATEEEVVTEEETNTAEEIAENVGPSPEVNEDGFESVSDAGIAASTKSISTAEVASLPEDSLPLAPQYARVAGQASLPPQHLRSAAHPTRIVV